MAQQLIIPASPNETKLELKNGATSVITPVTFPASATDTVLDAVLTALNKVPTVNAGADETITLPTSSVTLSATASDTDGTISSYTWSVVSGTGATITSPTSASTTVTGLTAGTYVFRITVTDNQGAASSDTKNVTVNADSSTGALTLVSSSAKSAQAATVHTLTGIPAGALIVLATTYEGTGKSSTAASSPALTWTKQSDAQAAGSGDAELYTAVYPAGGSLTVTSNWGTGFQTSVVYVLTGQEVTPAGNKALATGQPAPSVNILTTKENSLLIGVSADFNGKDGALRAYRDGAVEKFYARAADKSGTAYHYTKQATAVKTYTVGLTAPVSQATGTIVYEVRSRSGATPPPVNQPPTVNAGNDQTITLPANSVTLAATAADSDGTIASYAWSKVSGGATTITTPSTVKTSVTGLVQGTYVFRVTVTDNSGATAADDITVVVNSANTPPPPSGSILGFGAGAVGGGNSSTVSRVTTAAAFTSAIGSNKTVICDADMTIGTRFDITNTSYLTIDANGHDVTINNNGNGVVFSLNGANTHHIIVKGIRFTGGGDDGIQVLDGAHDIAFLNCSSYDNGDGNLDITTGAYNVTVQYCILGRGQSQWSGNMLVAYDPVKNNSVHHNLFMPATSGGVGERNPLVSHSTANNLMVDFRNNLVYRWGRSGGTGSGYGSGVSDGANANFVNNYYYSGAAADSAIVGQADPDLGKGNFYASGNKSGNGSSIASSSHAEWPVPASAQIPDQSACDAARDVLAKVGPAKKNSVEQGWLNSITLPGC